ncbi:uncharacterized protein LOC127266472 [Andrographis paniculata]|uniref:uncharacterized protein LOC127266472 n=1 Tax=Andrographis paniculata TaxID=175694 RepID=UPI0021E823BB|nr:uncharacterized protein LOC127266472 [Andrographis paniculata]
MALVNQSPPTTPPTTTSSSSINVMILLLLMLLLIHPRLHAAAARSPMSADPAPPLPSPTAAAEEPTVLSYAQFLPSSSSTSKDVSSDQSEQQQQLESSLSMDSSSSNNDLSSGILSLQFQADPEVEKICQSTDYPHLCLAEVIPNLINLRGSGRRIDTDAVLQAAVKGTNMFAKHCQELAQDYANKPGSPPELKSALKDCQDGYDTVVDNFEETLEAFATHDVGTMRSMLSAVITFVGDCEDSLKQLSVQSPMSAYAEKLTNMTSNCLAITSLLTSN